MSSLREANWESIRDVPLFGGLSDEELKALFKLGQNQKIEALTNIILEGELSGGMYLILEGAAGVFKTDKVSGNTYDVCELHEGAIFGEFSLVDDQPRSANVRTIRDSELLYFSKESFTQFMAGNLERKSRFYEGCSRALVVRLRELDQEYVQSQYQLWQTALEKKKGAA